MQLSAAHIQSIRSSWRYFRNIDTCILGDAFYTKLFSDHPFLKHAFREDLSVYYKKLHDFLNLAVARIERNESMDAAIREMTDPHPFGPFHHQHLHKLEDSLIWTLQKGLGPEWTAEIEQAWKTFYQLLTGKLNNTLTIAE